MAMNSYDWTNGVLTFSNAAGKVTLDRRDVPEAWHDWLVEYGLKQWIGSFMAKASNGGPKEYLETATAAIVRAKAGDFLTRGTGASIDAIMGEVFEVAAEAAKRPKKDAEAWLEKYMACDADAKAKVRAKPGIAAAIKTVQARRKLTAATPEKAGEFDPFA